MLRPGISLAFTLFQIKLNNFVTRSKDMRYLSRKLLLGMLLCLIIAVSGLHAQEYGTIQALATVVSSLSVVGSSNLQFGAVTPGINKSVDKAAVGFAGEWNVTGTANAEVTMDITLPDSLVTSDSVAYLRINFTSTDASWDDGTGTGQTGPAGILDPNSFATLRLGAGAQLSVWLGGTVLPSISQTGGDYAADVILTVAYTGN